MRVNFAALPKASYSFGISHYNLEGEEWKSGNPFGVFHFHEGDMVLYETAPSSLESNAELLRYDNFSFMHICS